MGVQSDVNLRRLRDVRIEKVLINIQQLNLSTVIATAYSDGCVDFRDRTTLEILPSDDKTRQVSSLGQIGFTMSGAEPCKLIRIAAIDI